MPESSKPLCIIPARGGSRRIPRKNLRNFCGKPIIAYPIEAALAADIFSDVIVSTDDAEIAGLAVQLGASVPFMRSADTSTDSATTFAVWQEVIENYQEKGARPLSAASLMATAPFVSPSLLRQAWQSLESHPGWDALMPVVRYSPPIQRAMRVEGEVLKMIWPEHRFSRSQDLAPSFHDAGLFYFFRTHALSRFRSLREAVLGPFEVPATSAHDIDEEEDWLVAEEKFRRWNT